MSEGKRVLAMDLADSNTDVNVFTTAPLVFKTTTGTCVEAGTSADDVDPIEGTFSHPGDPANVDADVVTAMPPTFEPDTDACMEPNGDFEGVTLTGTADPTHGTFSNENARDTSVDPQMTDPDGPNTDAWPGVLENVEYEANDENFGFWNDGSNLSDTAEDLLVPEAVGLVQQTPPKPVAPTKHRLSPAEQKAKILRNNAQHALASFDAGNLKAAAEFFFKVYDMARTQKPLDKDVCGSANACVAYCIVQDPESMPKKLVEAESAICVLELLEKEPSPLRSFLRAKLCLRKYQYQDAHDFTAALECYLNGISQIGLLELRFPYSDRTVPFSTAAYLAKAIGELWASIQDPVEPDHICMWNDCEDSRIYYSYNFRGYRVVVCSQKCTLTYHKHCFDKVLAILELEDPKSIEAAVCRCLTPDCLGIVMEIRIYGPDTTLKTSFTHKCLEDVDFFSAQVESSDQAGESSGNPDDDAPLNKTIEKFSARLYKRLLMESGVTYFYDDPILTSELDRPGVRAEVKLLGGVLAVLGRKPDLFRTNDWFFRPMRPGERIESSVDPEPECQPVLPSTFRTHLRRPEQANRAAVTPPEEPAESPGPGEAADPQSRDPPGSLAPSPTRLNANAPSFVPFPRAGRPTLEIVLKKREEHEKAAFTINRPQLVKRRKRRSGSGGLPGAYPCSDPRSTPKLNVNAPNFTPAVPLPSKPSKSRSKGSSGRSTASPVQPVPLPFVKYNYPQLLPAAAPMMVPDPFAPFVPALMMQPYDAYHQMMQFQPLQIVQVPVPIRSFFTPPMMTSAPAPVPGMPFLQPVSAGQMVGHGATIDTQVRGDTRIQFIAANGQPAGSVCQYRDGSEALATAGSGTTPGVEEMHDHALFQEQAEQLDAPPADQQLLTEDQNHEIAPIDDGSHGPDAQAVKEVQEFPLEQPCGAESKEQLELRLMEALAQPTAVASKRHFEAHVKKQKRREKHSSQFVHDFYAQLNSDAEGSEKSGRGSNGRASIWSDMPDRPYAVTSNNPKNEVAPLSPPTDASGDQSILTGSFVDQSIVAAAIKVCDESHEAGTLPDPQPAPTDEPTHVASMADGRNAESAGDVQTTNLDRSSRFVAPVGAVPIDRADRSDSGSPPDDPHPIPSTFEHLKSVEFQNPYGLAFIPDPFPGASFLSPSVEPANGGGAPPEPANQFVEAPKTTNDTTGPALEPSNPIVPPGLSTNEGAERPHSSTNSHTGSLKSATVTPRLPSPGVESLVASSTNLSDIGSTGTTHAPGAIGASRKRPGYLKDVFTRVKILDPTTTVYSNAEFKSFLRDCLNTTQRIDRKSIEHGTNLDTVAGALLDYIQECECVRMASIARGDVCAICNKAMDSSDPVVKMDCGHSFHEICLVFWAQEGNPCPVPGCGADLIGKIANINV